MKVLSEAQLHLPKLQFSERRGGLQRYEPANITGAMAGKAIACGFRRRFFSRGPHRSFPSVP